MVIAVKKSGSVRSVDWQQLNTVLLDMDGTLLDLKFDNFFWGTLIPDEWGRLQGLDLEASQARLAPLFAKEKGRLTWYCLEFWEEKLGLDIRLLQATVAEKIQWLPQAEDFLGSLKASHLNMILVTNAHPANLEAKLKRIPLTHWFDSIVSSHDYNTPKETPAFWGMLMKKHPFTPNQTLFIDDSEDVLDSAFTFGIPNLITLTQPDSSLPCRNETRFPAIHLFDEIMQGLPSFE